MRLDVCVSSIRTVIGTDGKRGFLTVNGRCASIASLSSVRLLQSPFTEAVAANRTYLLALEVDRLLAPFLREAGLEAKAKSYGNWESTGLDGHTAGHYLSALSTMISSGADAPDGELHRRLDYSINELARCQRAVARPSC